MTAVPLPTTATAPALPLHRPTSLALEPYAVQEQQWWPASGRHILASATADTVVVYQLPAVQAFTPAIAAAAARQGHFLGIPGFLEGRIAWIKTNFCWMMYRSGWASKPAQEGVLAITLRRPFLERLLGLAMPSSAGQACRAASVVLQWDPDHYPDGSEHERRAIQLALRGSVKDEFISGRAVLGIEDTSPFCRDMAGRAAAPGAAAAGWPDLLVPCKRVLQLEAGLAAHIEADAWDGLLV